VNAKQAAASPSTTQAPALKVPLSVLADPFSSKNAQAYLSSREGEITAAIYNVMTGQLYTYRPGVTEQTASIVKVDILETLLWQLKQSGEPLSDEQADEASDMIEQSDNDDATALWNDDGDAPGVARYDKLIGLTDTTPNFHWGETTTTARDQIRLLSLLAFANPYLDPASRSYQLGLMEDVAGWEDWGVSSGPPATPSVALKNGWLPITGNDWQINSIGYVNDPGRRYLVAILTTDNPNEQYGIASIEGLSSILWSELAVGRAPEPR
jgi:hypothetical protein